MAPDRAWQYGSVEIRAVELDQPPSASAVGVEPSGLNAPVRRWREAGNRNHRAAQDRMGALGNPNGQPRPICVVTAFCNAALDTTTRIEHIVNISRVGSDSTRERCRRTG